jgi:tRNA pseudouridine13 synthase
MQSLPFLTPSFPGIGGTIKQRPEDFFVQEIPLYDPVGEGEHVYAEFQKTGLTTFDLIARISHDLKVPQLDIGFAGMKDAAAVTRQVISIRGTTEEAVMGLKIAGVQPLWAIRHNNKLRLGHLSANRFAIKIRNVSPTDVVKIRPVLKELETRGIPNYFGEQRFGFRNNNDLLGAALLRGDHKALLSNLLGKPIKGVDDAQSAGARAAFDRSDLPYSLGLWPKRFGMERRVLHRLIKTHRPSAAVFSIEDKLRRLWISALQSRVFNQVLAQRLTAGTFDQILPGDLAYKHDNGACFLVDNTAEATATEQPRAAAFEISPTGPLIGYRVSMPEGTPLEIEQAVLAEFQLTAADFRKPGRLKVKGARRATRVKPTDVDLSGGVDEHGPHVTLAFTLPSGAFATVLLREIMKEGTSLEGAAIPQLATPEPDSEIESDTPDSDAPSHPLGRRAANEDD